MVRVVGLEPTRLTAEEPKGNVTSVKEERDFFVSVNSNSV